MRVLVIGGTGTISTPLTTMLAEEGHEVTVFNRGLTAEKLPETVRRIHGDRSDRRAFETVLETTGGVDCVIEMIAFTQEDIESDIRAFRGRIEQLIFCSTVDVYTKRNLTYPISEDAPRHPEPSFSYAYDKAKCEELLSAAHARGDFHTTVMRPAATYREGRSPVHTFRGGSYHLDRIAKNKPIIIHGDGTAIWSACHASDVARAFAKAVGNARAYGRAYNVTGEEWMTWNYYWRCAADAVDAPLPEVIHIPTDVLYTVSPNESSWCWENFQHDNIFDNAAARADLGFRYTVPWSSGIESSVEWIRAHGGFENSDDFPFYDRIIAAWRKAVAVMRSELEREVK